MRRALLGAVVLAATALPTDAQALDFPAACTGTTGDTASLVTAITNANANAGPDTVQLRAGCTYIVKTADNFWYGPNGLPPIASDVTIEGHGAKVARGASAPAFRLFFVGADPADSDTAGYTTPGPGRLVLRDVTLSGGAAEGGGSNGGGGGAGLGGAIFNQGVLVVERSTLTNNFALGGGSNIGGSGSNGGGIGSDSGAATGGGFGGDVGVGASGGVGGAVLGQTRGGGGAGFGSAEKGHSGIEESPNFSRGGGERTGLGGDGRDSGAGDFGLSGDGSGGGGRGGNSDEGNGGAFGFGGGAANVSGAGGGIGGGGGHGAGAGGGGFGAGGGFGFGPNGSGGEGGFGGGGGGAVSTGGGGAAAGFGGGAGLAGGGGGGGAGMGGAIFNMQGDVTLRATTVTANQAIGGSDNHPTGDHAKGIGGGLFNLNGDVTIVGSTFFANTAAFDGASIYNLVYDGAKTRTAQTVLRDSIVANGTGPVDLASNKPASTAGPANVGDAVAAAGELNLVRTSAARAAGTVTGSPLTGDPLLGALGDNGGLTPTLAPAAGSPVIDAGSSFGLSTDQRGLPRPSDFPALTNAGDGSDIGAVEVQVPPTVPDPGTPGDTGTPGNGGPGPGAGPGPGPGGGPPPDLTPASLTGYSLVRNTIHYTLSEPATVVFTVERRKGGRFVGGKCQKPTRKTVKRRKCDLPQSGSFSQAGKSGKNSLPFKGRKLKPGSYSLVAAATDAAGNKSKPRKVAFKIVRR